MIDKFENDDHRQIILGTLLGNGYICKGRQHAYFCMRHNDENLLWLQSKAAELQCYASKTAWHNYNTTYTWRSASGKIFNELREFCYKDNKKTVTMEWLDQLRDIAIAVWYGDSGCLTGRGKKNACLRTQSFGCEGNKTIEKYFNEVGIPCNVNKSRGSWVIVFTVPGTDILMSKLVAPNLPSNRYFKLDFKN